MTEGVPAPTGARWQCRRAFRPYRRSRTRPPLWKGRWRGAPEGLRGTGLRIRRRSGKFERFLCAIPQSASLTAPFPQGSLRAAYRPEASPPGKLSAKPTNRVPAPAGAHYNVAGGFVLTAAAGRGLPCVKGGGAERRKDWAGWGCEFAEGWANSEGFPAQSLSQLR